MRQARVHIFGAAGSGTTSVGKAVAHTLQAPFFDTDSYYWLETDPPFTEKRPPPDRVIEIERDIRGLDSWVLAGSLCNWGDALLPHFTLVVFLSLDTEKRLERLAWRERERHGDRILEGGDMHRMHEQFMDWAASYDYAKAPTRSLDLHQRWMGKPECPVMRLQSDRSAQELAEEILGSIEQ